MATAISAAQSGIGVIPLPRRLAPADLVEVGPGLRLPALPPSKVVMLSRHVGKRAKAIQRMLRLGFQAAIGPAR